MICGRMRSGGGSGEDPEGVMGEKESGRENTGSLKPRGNEYFSRDFLKKKVERATTGCDYLEETCEVR